MSIHQNRLFQSEVKVLPLKKSSYWTCMDLGEHLFLPRNLAKFNNKSYLFSNFYDKINNDFRNLKEFTLNFFCYAHGFLVARGSHYIPLPSFH